MGDFLPACANTIPKLAPSTPNARTKTLVRGLMEIDLLLDDSPEYSSEDLRRGIVLLAAILAQWKANRYAGCIWERPILPPPAIIGMWEEKVKGPDVSAR